MPGISLLTYIAGGAGIVLLLALGVQTYRVSDAQRRLAEANNIVIRLQDNNATLTGNQQRLQLSLDEQNKAVDAAKAEGDMRAKAADDELARVRGTLTARNRLLADQIAARTVPQGVEVCRAALDEARRPNQ